MDRVNEGPPAPSPRPLPGAHCPGGEGVTPVGTSVTGPGHFQPTRLPLHLEPRAEGRGRTPRRALSCHLTMGSPASRRLSTTHNPATPSRELLLAPVPRLGSGKLQGRDHKTHRGLRGAHVCFAVRPWAVFTPQDYAGHLLYARARRGYWAHRADGPCPQSPWSPGRATQSVSLE